MDNTAQRTKNQIDGESALRGKRNVPLIVGLGLVLVITILAIIGPNIAPNDPAEEHNIIMIEGTWYVPPFDIGTPGYPLGSDRFGRDIYSRLLWGIRPTMIMVLVVSIVRLFLGVIIGLTAGWFTGKLGRFLNGLIQVALAIPVLLVALGAIAIIGVEFGIWAFIIGLSLTGWVDTALQVREQTHIVKNQVYVEASSAMGATSQQILSGHILKQVTPMLLMLFAFEVSSTLMLTAGLGFLGYYIGGDVWVETDDFVARRISGSPELGQMLATSWLTLTKPWALVAVGTTIFLTVLGFNLIGEGLRQNLGFAKVQRKSFLTETRNKMGLWFDDAIWHPLVQFFRIRPLRLGLMMIGLFFISSLGSLLLIDAAHQSNNSKVIALFNPSEAKAIANSLSDEPGNASATPTDIEVSTIEKTFSPSLSWEFFDEVGFPGGPSLALDRKHLYLASDSGSLYALNLSGELIWQSELTSGGIGTPAVSPEGDIYVSDAGGGLNKLSQEGDLIWRFQSEVGETSHSGPAIGPDDNIFYTVGNQTKAYVQAVSPNGGGLWNSEANTRLFYETPIPSPDGKYVFLKDDIFSSQNGAYQDFKFDLEVIRYFSGENGLNYLLSGHKIIQWEEQKGAIEVLDIYEWDSSEFGEYMTPGDVAVDSSGVSFQLYTTPGGNSQMIWVSENDQALGTTELRISGSNLIDMKEDNSAIICGGGSFRPISTDCALVNPESETPLWRYHLGNFGPVTGGFILNGVYYGSTENGFAFGIDENYQEISTSGETAASSANGNIDADLGFIWSYQATDQISSISDDEPSGYIYLTSEDDKLHILNPNGEIFNVIQLPYPLFYQISDTGRSPALSIQPTVLPNGDVILISDESIVYALDLEGEILWEHRLEAPPANHPILDEMGNLFIIDSEAGVSTFNSDGFKWRFQSGAADLPANGAVFGPDGNLYYVVTDYSKGYIQAVSGGGENLWVVEASTRDFYGDLLISEDGKYISLAEVLVSTEIGEAINYEYGDKIDEFIFALNGQKYLRSLHTVSEWQPGPDGISLLSSGIVSEEDTTLRPPLGSSADANGIVWLYYPEKYIGGGIIVVWMSPEGELLGNHLNNRNFQTIIDIDMERSLLTECVWFEETSSIECTTYSPSVEEPIRLVSLNDIPSYQGGMVEGDFLYVFGDNNEIIKFFLGEPVYP